MSAALNLDLVVVLVLTVSLTLSLLMYSGLFADKVGVGVDVALNTPDCCC